MIVSHAHKFAILVPWKTASSTLHARFESVNDSPYSRFYYFSPYLNRVTHQHITCAEFAAFPEAKLGYTTAAFVRNPYDRVYSGFIQVQRDLANQREAPFPAPWIRELVLKQLEDNRRQLIQADYDFDRWLAGLTEDQIYAVGRNTSFPLHPTHYWTHLAGEQYVSFVGHVETFESDLESFCALVRIAEPNQVNRNVSEGAIAPGPCRSSNIAAPAEQPPVDYRYANAMHPASIDKINRLFAQDFTLFGYRKVVR